MNLLSAIMPPAGLAAVIWLLSSRPVPQAVPLIPHIDKVIHFFVFGLLCFLILRAIRKIVKKSLTKKHLLTGVLLTVAYGLTDEAHQYFIPSRHADIFDLLCDSLGAVSAAFIFKRGH